MRQLYCLAEFIFELKLEQVPTPVVRAAKYCLIDNICAALGAADDLLIQLFSACDGNAEDASLWGHKKMVPVRTAAFINGMMGHVLELDDVHTGSKAHIGTVVIPAACAKLMKLDKPKIISALGLAGTQSFGTWAFMEDGTTNKILHPGKAALNGLDAALLSSAGMTGSPHILNSPDGSLYPAMSDDYDYEAISKNLGQVYEILNMDKKPYPCCRSTHCAIDGVICLCRENSITVEQVERVVVRTYEIGYRQCGERETSRKPLLCRKSVH